MDVDDPGYMKAQSKASLIAGVTSGKYDTQRAIFLLLTGGIPRSVPIYDFLSHCLLPTRNANTGLLRADLFRGVGGLFAWSCDGGSINNAVRFADTSVQESNASRWPHDGEYSSA